MALCTQRLVMQRTVVLFVLLASLLHCCRATVEIVFETLPILSEEAHDPKYTVSVARRPEEAVDEGNAAANLPAPIVMKTGSGREYQCSLPHGLGSGGNNETELVAEEEQQPSDLLQGMEGDCLYRLEEWWTYEFCFHQKVRQYHKQGEQIVTDYILGSWDGNISSINSVRTEEDTLFPSVESKYVSERYHRGDACDITGEPRQTEVRYVCSEDGKESLASVKEASTCQYLVVVSAPLLCDHAAFKVKQVPVREIACHPLDNSDPLELEIASASAEHRREADPDLEVTGDKSENSAAEDGESAGRDEEATSLTDRFNNGQGLEIAGLTIHSEAMLNELITRILGDRAKSGDPDAAFFDGLEEDVDETDDENDLDARTE